ncbi:helix-turn-helix domain-containing protein [Nocardia farcinica]|uniref:helix-turn-helix domain-containing protein n=1 Tax=Nocardia farcinica TaxID=37329 RepID=UPI000DFE87FC|nr:helix-turn-helix domain-containing protein [Nocardia farcinica]MCZ9330224.1 helix-turn-helix domain-containing protein [Nocardia farcinica]SUE26772.1 transcriptional regulator [Nocardia farcinica]
MRPIVCERELGEGWELTRPTTAALPGVRMSGFHDRGTGGLDMQVAALSAVTVVIDLGDHPLSVAEDTAPRTVDSLVAGLAPAPHRVRSAALECLELRLSPVTAYALLDAAPSELNGVPSAEDLWGAPARRLRERLRDTQTWPERFALATDFLAGHDTGRSMDPEVTAAWQTMLTRNGQVRIAELAETTGWSRKRLWSRFTAQVGVTPKRAAMVVRFRRAFDLLLAGHPPAEVAARCGYTDQSHLHRDVTAFSGLTPGLLATA